MEEKKDRKAEKLKNAGSAPHRMSKQIYVVVYVGSKYHVILALYRDACIYRKLVVKKDVKRRKK